MRRLAAVLVGVVALGSVARGALAQGVPAGTAALGAISGLVRNASGDPVAGARITIEALALQARSDSAGNFVLAGIPAGEWTVSFRQLGYRPAVATLAVPASQTLNLTITLVPLVAELDAVVVRGALLNQVAGTVVDEQGRPIPGVVVDVIGDDRRTTTSAEGRFILTDFKPGSYILQFRAMGYRVTQYSVRMIEQIDRDISIRLNPMERGDRFTAEVAAQVALESNRRIGFRGALAVVVGREELERWDTAPLDVALQGSIAAQALRETNGSCLLINGFEPLSAQTAGSGFDGLGSRRRAPTSIAPSGSISSAPVARASGGNWLSHFRANEVEMVEIYPPGSENSRTLCNRFPPSSGCGCPPDPSGIVIWLKR